MSKYGEVLRAVTARQPAAISVGRLSTAGDRPSSPAAGRNVAVPAHAQVSAILKI
jgi:hypothetical protein